MNVEDKIYIAGHKGMVGSAIWRKLEEDGFLNLIGCSSAELDLRDQSAVANFFNSEKPAFVILAAAKVGGILANDSAKADFLYDNITIQTNIIHQSYLCKVKKLLFLGSSCIYPKHAPQPLKEEYLLTGLLEPTNESYAIAKITGIKLCKAFRDQYGCNFISAMPTNLYGPNDNYDLKTSHVLPALIRKFFEAKSAKERTVVVWGSGIPRRELMHVDDLADACIFLMRNYNEEDFVNIGTGTDISIKDLAELVADIIGYRGSIFFDTSKPDGTPRKLMDNSKLQNIGWSHKIELRVGISQILEEIMSKEQRWI